jgi:co-chaperonin GroES (HSP10)
MDKLIKLIEDKKKAEKKLVEQKTEHDFQKIDQKIQEIQESQDQKLAQELQAKDNKILKQQDEELVKKLVQEGELVKKVNQEFQREKNREFSAPKNDTKIPEKSDTKIPEKSDTKIPEKSEIKNTNNTKKSEKFQVNKSKEFHIITKHIVSRCYVLPHEIEMKKVKIDQNRNAFSGIYLPTKDKDSKETVTVLMLGESLKTDYLLNDLVSVQIDEKLIEHMKNSGANNIKNHIIVNTAKDVRAVVVELKFLRHLIPFPDSILMHEIKRDPELNEKYKAAGIDISPDAKNWNTAVNIHLLQNVFDKPADFLKSISQVRVKVTCYMASRIERIVV